MKSKRSKPKAVSRNPQRSRERILKAALRDFAAKGFAGARVDAIAARARINKRMLYHYFGNKEGLFREVLRRKITERSAWLAAVPEPIVDRLPAWFQLACRDRQWIQMLEWEALQWGDSKVIDEERRRASIGKAVERIRQQQASGVLEPGWDPGQLLLSMMALTAYPLAFPQLTRLITGLKISDSRFQKQRAEFLRRFAVTLQPKAKSK